MNTASDPAPAASHKNVYVVRPYHERIRKPVFEALTQLGYHTPEGWESADKSTDNEVIKDLVGLSPSLLVIPFHIGRDNDGERIHGLQTLEKIVAARPDLISVPVLMPVSRFGKAGLILHREECRDLLSRMKVLIIHEEKLAANLTATIRLWLAGR